MDRKLTISIAVAAGTGVALLLARRRIAVAIKRWSRSRVEDDDVTLARKVETHIFRPHDAPKGDVSVDVEAGVVYLRGITDAHWSERFAAGAKEVPGIVGVKNLLHPPGTPAPPAPPRGVILERADRED
jgi:osmotically-inducible protein OsmY